MRRPLALLLLSLIACPDPDHAETRDLGPVPTCLDDGLEPGLVLDQDATLGELSQVTYFLQNRDELFTDGWTNWHREPMQLALVKLAAMRNWLEAYALTDAYLPEYRVGYPEGVVCEPSDDESRRIDGRCNDPLDPLMGAAGIRFSRNVPLDATWPDEAHLLDPNPREISRKLLTRSEFHEVPFLNLYAAAWVQFQTHDWFDHSQALTDTLAIPLADDDPLRERGLSNLHVLRTAPDPTRRTDEDGVLPPTYLNRVTHWWDGSQIYGSDLETADRLRAFEGGRLLLPQGHLPRDSSGQSDAGFTDNWWIGLEVLHTLFAKEHNAIADHLAQAYPEWSDQQLYDKARLINAALIARIHTIEWTPAILPNEALTVGMHTNWYGLNRYLEPKLEGGRDPILHGVVGGDRILDRQPFAMTEEFVAVYRMHPLLPDALELPSGASIPLEQTLHADAADLYQEHGQVEVLRAFAQAHPGALVLDNYPAFMQDIELPVGGILDLGAIDILRDRERGVPRYNETRRLLGLPPITRFEDLTDDDDHVARLTEVYGGDVEKLDLFIGTLAEGHRPTCYGFGETLFQVFTLMATRRLKADRFYTELYTPEVYTQEGLEWIEHTSFAQVLLRHHPELAADGLTPDHNAFAPW
ncbi:MAG: peroxidase [Deltaproteobacteria bacterium]|nr:MAG: peroxidase [Deltaproteobacteria bacterium]